MNIDPMSLTDHQARQFLENLAGRMEQFFPPASGKE